MALLSLLVAASCAWFDPLVRYRYPLQRVPAYEGVRPLLIYIPGLDGTHGSPFVQFPDLARAGFDLRVQDVDVAAAASSFDATVDDAIAYMRDAGRPVLLMGESYGGVVASAVALREPSVVTALVLVNPATAFSVRPDLQADMATLKTVPEPIFQAASFAFLGRKTFDLGFVANAVRDLFVERKMERLRESDPELAGYFDAALADMMSQIGQAPRGFMLARLGHLERYGAEVEAKLPSLQPPCLVVAGTADKLLSSEAEARRLQAILGPERCKVACVPGAGHIGTLDQRCDLVGLIEEWAAEPANAAVLEPLRPKRAQSSPEQG